MRTSDGGGACTPTSNGLKTRHRTRTYAHTHTRTHAQTDAQTHNQHAQFKALFAPFDFTADEDE